MNERATATEQRLADVTLALKKLANEAHGFLSMSDVLTHGHSNIAVMRTRIDEARALLGAAWCAGKVEGCSGRGRPACQATECMHGVEPCPEGNHFKPIGGACNFIHETKS